MIMYPIMQYLAHIYTTHSHYFKVIFYIPKGVFNVDVFLTYLTVVYMLWIAALFCQNVFSLNKPYFSKTMI